MSERASFAHHSEVVTSQRTGAFVMSMFGLTPEQIQGETILDLGSGYQQAFAQHAEKAGATVISLDPNLPHSDEYVVNNMINDGMANGLSRGLAYDAIQETLPAILRSQGTIPSKDPKIYQAQVAAFYRKSQAWPENPYGKAVSGLGQALPFQDRVFDRIVATTSVPYGVSLDVFATILGEANRVLRHGGKAHFWPMVSGGIYEHVSLTEIRDILKKARANAPNKEAKAALSGFGLHTWVDPEIEKEQRKAEELIGPLGSSVTTLVLTRKTA
jgi:SAM-dependent methyltransferase